MKKFTKIFAVISFSFIILFSSLLLAGCGTKPFDVKGKTLQGNGKATFAWDETVTQEIKNEVYKNWNVSNDEELTQALIKECGANYKEYKLFFNEDGTVKTSDPDEEGYNFIQSKDLKTIDIYAEDYTEESEGSLVFKNGNFCFVNTDYDYITIYIIFEVVE